MCGIKKKEKSFFSAFHWSRSKSHKGHTMFTWQTFSKGREGEKKTRQTFTTVDTLASEHKTQKKPNSPKHSDNTSPAQTQHNYRAATLQLWPTDTQKKGKADRKTFILWLYIFWTACDPLSLYCCSPLIMFSMSALDVWMSLHCQQTTF